MIKQLTDEYIPEQILHREKQIEEIKKVFTNFKKHGCASNIIILGVTGSGKTVIAKKVIKEEDNSVYINCLKAKTPYQVLKIICNSNVKTYSSMLDKAIEYLKENPKIIILDEVDKIKGFVSLMNDLNTIYRETMTPVILITMKRDIEEKMPSDVKKTLFFEKISLPSYNALELKDILTSRLNSLSIPELNGEAISLISALSAKQGSARLLMSITIKCLQKGDFSNKSINNIYKQSISEEDFNFVNDINTTEREFLRKLLDSCDEVEEISSESLKKIISGDFTDARISQIVDTFEKSYNIVKSRHVYMGRGRTRLIKFVSKEKFVKLNEIFGLSLYRE